MRKSLPCLISLAAAVAPAAGASCQAQSGAQLVPVLELYTSEGCSSCPPADRWISTLKPAAAQGRVVVQAFHVGYWDYIGWVDRFAAPAHTVRQRELAAANGQRGIYTPQLVRSGRDWRDYASALDRPAGTPGAAITMSRSAPDLIEATVTPQPGVTQWAAYWTVTEHGHSSKVKAGENAGEFLQHDFVVRQYVPAGTYQGAQRLRVRTVAPQAAHPQQVSLVVFDPRSATPLQALSLGC